MIFGSCNETNFHWLEFFSIPHKVRRFASDSTNPSSGFCIVYVCSRCMPSHRFQGRIKRTWPSPIACKCSSNVCSSTKPGVHSFLIIQNIFYFQFEIHKHHVVPNHLCPPFCICGCLQPHETCHGPTRKLCLHNHCGCFTVLFIWILLTTTSCLSPRLSTPRKIK